jgi:hypothetical protein
MRDSQLVVVTSVTLSPPLPGAGEKSSLIGGFLPLPSPDATRLYVAH